MSTDCGELRGTAKTERLRGTARPQQLEGESKVNGFLTGRVVTVCRAEIQVWTTIEAENWETIESENWELIP